MQSAYYHQDIKQALHVPVIYWQSLDGPPHFPLQYHPVETNKR